MTVSKAAERSRRIRADDRPFALARWRASVTAIRAVSVECPVLKPDWFGSRRSFCMR